MPNYGWRKLSKCIIESDRRFEILQNSRYPSSRYRESTVVPNDTFKFGSEKFHDYLIHITGVVAYILF